METKDIMFVDAKVYNEKYTEAKQRLTGIIGRLEDLDDYFCDAKTYDCKGKDLETKVVSEVQFKRMCIFNDRLRDFLCAIETIICDIKYDK